MLTSVLPRVLTLILFTRCFFPQINKLNRYILHAVVYMYLWVCEVMLIRETNYELIRPLFVAQITWYTYGLYDSICYDRGRKDFYMLLAHHILSISLLYSSFHFQLHRVGLIICIEQDPADIMLNLVKIVHQKWPGLRRLHRFLLGLTTMVWWTTRVFVFWLLLLVFSVMMNNKWTTLMFASLCCLWMMQIVWGLALAQMCWNRIPLVPLRDTSEENTQEKTDNQEFLKEDWKTYKCCS